MIGQNSSDLFRYVGILKGNYKKGISNLRNILASKETAEEFCSSAGVCVIFELEIKDNKYIHDQNSAELLALLNEYGYYNIALGTFLAMKSGLEGTFDEILASPTEMAAIAASEVAMMAIFNNPATLAAIVASPAIAESIGTVVQSQRERIGKALGSVNSTYFTYSERKQVGNGAGTFDDGQNTNTIYIPHDCYDDGNTDHGVYYGYSGTQQIASIPRHSGNITVGTGISFRGVRVIGTGSTAGHVSFRVYTLKQLNS